MDRAASRMALQYARVRKYERKVYRGPLSLFVPRNNHDSPPENGITGCSPGWSYSLSQGGVGLITQERIDSVDVWIGVHLPNQTIRWKLGRIVRRRPIPEEEFFEYGVSFVPESVAATDNGA